MLFNSIPYLVFLPVVFLIYWFILRSSLDGQNIFLLIASYVFYCWWDCRFLVLIILSTLVDFYVAQSIKKASKERIKKKLLLVSLIVNLGLLGYFKYCNFFIESFNDAFESLGFSSNMSSLVIILPVGISFYTFQTLSYTIDVYRGKMLASDNLLNFAAYVAFFPQLVAGPIERAVNLLPQFSSSRKFEPDRAISGINLILWGLFQKVVIADSCATYVNSIFDNYETMNSLSLILGSFYFAFQIYGDFAGYSNIAIGTARLFGFDLMRNFNNPYFSRDIAEFWRRWHISLSTWFRDYLYIPLGGSRGSKWVQLRNVLIIFIVSGFWHGANWTFVCWGVIHAGLFLPILLRDKNRRNLDQVAHSRILPTTRELIKMLVTFSLVCLAWVFFRSDSIKMAFNYIKRLLTQGGFNIQYLNIERYSPEMVLLIMIFVIIEWFHRTNEHPFGGRFKWIKLVAVIFMLLTLGVYSNHNDFIYFQF